MLRLARRFSVTNKIEWTKRKLYKNIVADNLFAMFTRILWQNIIHFVKNYKKKSTALEEQFWKIRRQLRDNYWYIIIKYTVGFPGFHTFFFYWKFSLFFIVLLNNLKLKQLYIPNNRLTHPPPRRSLSCYRHKITNNFIAQCFFLFLYLLTIFHCKFNMYTLYIW